MDDWFGQLVNGAGIVLSAESNAKAQAAIAQQQIAANDRAFQQSLISRTTQNANGITSPNMILIIMIGLAALFVINQANK